MTRPILALAAALLAGCITTPVAVDCRLPEPPAVLLAVPPPLPPIPADLPARRP
jgi:hypothetical protein